MFDIAIIGAGPAGYSAAINARKRDKSALVIGQNGGWLARAERIDNYPGLPGISGAQLLSAMREQAVAMGAEVRPGVVHQVMDMGGTFALSLGGDFVEARRIILCTGAKQPRLLPGEERLLGRGVSYCGTCDGMLYRGKRAAVIGLAADAPAEADFLREIGCDVHYYDGKKHRFEIRGAERADTLVVDGAAEPADVIFVLRAGFAADTLLPGLATEKGHIVVDEAYAASIPGVFAAGDCTGAPYQIPAAVGEGNCAALSVVRWLRNA